MAVSVKRIKLWPSVSNQFTLLRLFVLRFTGLFNKAESMRRKSRQT